MLLFFTVFGGNLVGNLIWKLQDDGKDLPTSQEKCCLILRGGWDTDWVELFGETDLRSDFSYL